MNIIKKAVTTLAVSALLIGTVATNPTYAAELSETPFNFTMDTKTVYSELRVKTDNPLPCNLKNHTHKNM